MIEGKSQTEGEGDDNLETMLIVLIIVGVLIGLMIIGGVCYSNRKMKNESEANVNQTKTLAQLDTEEMDPNIANGVTPGGSGIITPGNDANTNTDTNELLTNTNIDATDTLATGAVHITTNDSARGLNVPGGGGGAGVGLLNKTVSMSSVASEHHEDDIERMFEHRETDGNEITIDTPGDHTNQSGAGGDYGDYAIGNVTHNEEMVEGKSSITTKGGRKKKRKLKRTNGKDTKGEISTRDIGLAVDNEGDVVYQSWNVDQVSQWLQEKLIDANIDSSLVNSFMNEWKKQHISGTVLKLYQKDQQSLQEVKQDIQSSGNVTGIHAIWAVVKNEISML